MESNTEQRKVRVVAYIRKSSEDNKTGESSKQVNSLKYQKEFVSEAVNKYDLELLCRPFEDDKTGYTAFVRDAPNGFNEMLTYINEKDNRVEGIICTEISRLARNFGDGGMILWYLQNGNIQYIYTPSKVFTNSSSDQLMVAIEFAMSKKSSDDTGYRTKEGMNTKVKLLKHPSRGAILGYKTEGPEGAKKWVIDRKIARMVVDVFKQFATGGYTFDQIAEYAYNIGLRSKFKNSQSGKFSANTWRKRLTDFQYIGEFYHNGEKVSGEYEHLMDNNLFFSVQEVIRGNEHPKMNHLDYAFTGLIKCNLCGDPLSGTNKKGITYYRCGKKKLPCMKIKRITYIPELELESTLIEKFGNIEIDQEIWKAARGYVEELNQPERRNTEFKIRTFIEQIASEERFQTELGRKFIEGLVSKTEHDKLRENSSDKQNSLRASIIRLENMTKELEMVMEHFLDEVKYVTQKFKIALPENKREMVEIFCENLVWDGKKVRFDWRKPYYILAKQPKNSTMLPR